MENQNLEWKETWHDEYLKWICGFANSQGKKTSFPLNLSNKNNLSSTMKFDIYKPHYLIKTIKT